MRTDLLTGQRLRFDMEMDPEESIPGVIARGVREHVLIWTRPVLEAAGVDLRHLGYSQLATRKELERLAFVARCNAEALSANAGERIFEGSSDSSMELRFGPHTTPRIHFELTRRRISPLTLRKHGFHRLDWMNLLLSYCPESGEMLVHECQSCKSKLGWHYTWGIGICEFCETEVAPSIERHLPSNMLDDYRLFAKLSSPSPRKVASGFASLPPSLQTARRETLVRLATMIGGLAQEGHVVTTSRRAILNLPADVRASVIVTGTAFLRSWPQSFQAWVAERSEKLIGDRSQLSAFRSRLRRLVQAKLESDELTGLVIESFPDLREHPVHAFSKGRHYLYISTQKRLHLDTPHMEALRQWMGDSYRLSPTTEQFQKGQFDADVIDSLVPIFEGALPLNACSWRLKIPHYAIEQCCRPGLLTRQSHPAFLAVRGAQFIKSASLDTLTAQLLEAQSQTSRPSSAVSLAVAVKRIGGRLKPWGSILQALANGDIEFWVAGEKPTSKTIRLHASDLARFDQVADDPTSHGGSLPTNLSQADAAEILNLKPALLPVLGPKVGIHFAPLGRGLAAPLDTVVQAAEAIAWGKEISWHLGVRHDAVEGILLSQDIRPRAIGWSRPELVNRGILPPFRVAFVDQSSADDCHIHELAL